MEGKGSIQKMIFQQIKEKLPSNVSLVAEISELLNVGQDSAYRRIRGEKPLTFYELLKLKMHFGISVDALCGDQRNNVTFHCHIIDPLKFKVSDWLDKISNDMTMIYNSSYREIIYAAKDPPLFHYFQLPEIASFKVFFWEKTLFQFPDYDEKKFSLENLDMEVYNKGRKIMAMITKVPTIEIWNEHTFRILLSQIEYYWLSGFFARKDDLLNLLDKIEKWIQHIQKEAEYGFKFLYGSSPDGEENTYQLYVNEVVLNDNSILVRTEKGFSAYLTFDVLSLLHTTNQDFCQNMNKFFRGLMKKSNLISLTGAKERNHFFHVQLNELNQFRKRI